MDKNVNVFLEGDSICTISFDDSKIEVGSVSTRNQATSTTLKDDNPVQVEEAKRSPLETHRQRTRESEATPSTLIVYQRQIEADTAEALTKKEIRNIEADEAGQSIEKTIGKTEPDEDELMEIRKQVEAYHVHPIRTSGKIRKEIYNAGYKMPSENCLDDCKKLIEYTESPEVYNHYFALYEGQADALRTNSGLTDALPKHDIYKCVKRMAPLTGFPKIAKMIYRFRYAAALAVSGDIDGAMKESKKGYETLQVCLKDKTTAEIMAKTSVSCLYGYINVHLAQFGAKAAAAMTKEQELKDNIFKLISEGLQQAESIEDRDARNMWARMYLVKKTFCYLNIGLLGEDIFDPVELHITTNDREKASDCLERAKVNHWIETDKRRQMLYKRAKAKLHWLDGERSSAVESLKKAVDMAENFKREEKVFKQILQKWEEYMNSQSSKNTVV